jgi:uncharacterized protein DUF6178
MANPRPLLARLLNIPGLPEIVPRLPPEVLHRVIQHVGLEDCSEFLALATPEQLAPILDADLWRARETGADETFDAHRFGVWLEVLMEAGAAVASEKILGMDPELVIAGFSHHTAVFEHGAVSGYTTLDGVDVPRREMQDAQIESAAMSSKPDARPRGTPSSISWSS